MVCRAAAAAVLSLLLGAAGCDRRDAARILPRSVEGGDAQRGRALIERYPCGSCHTIPGVEDADSRIAPPLTDFALRKYIAGTAVNSADNLVRWLQDPQSVNPGTMMPALGVSAAEARHMAAYLYTLR